MFKRVGYLVALLLLVVAAGIAPLQTKLVSADSVNLMSNPSAETVDAANQPTNWTADFWGTQTTSLTSSTDAHTGTKSLNVNTTARTNGDAKWVPDAVAVTAGNTYTYSDYSKSAVATELDAAYTSTTGAVSYGYLGSVKASTAWQQTSVTFAIPAGTQKVSVLHILATVGSLTLDDFSLTSGAAATPPPTTPPPANGNLVLNPSMETANGTAPANWTSSSWGNNTTTFSYAPAGRTGSHSLTTTVANYTDGDAKWLFDPVTITGGSSYTYTDFYQSDVTTRVVVAYTTAAGATTYAEQGTAPAASAWTKYVATVTAPTDATSLTVFHLIDRAGSLSIDDVSVIAAAAIPVTTVPNASLETVSGTNPAQWQHNSWGNNSTTFTYATNGHTGTRSVKTTVTNYTDGDAKWYFTPIRTLTPGKEYKASAWFRTNGQPHVVIMSTDANGVASYITQPLPLPAATASTTWQQYSSSFTVPANSVSITVLFLMQSNGWVQTDDYDITPYSPTGFSEPLVSLTFDDGWASIYQNGLPLLQKYGFNSTQYIISGTVGTADYMTKAQVKAFQTAGSEIGSHTVTHPFLTQLGATRLTTELQKSQANLQTWFGTAGVAQNFASPYGDYNTNVITQIQKYYGSHRSVDVGYNSKDNFNAYNLLVQNITATTTPAQVAAWVAQAKATNTWLIIVYHQVEPTLVAGDNDAVTTANLDTELSNLKASGVPVKTIAQALAEVKSQL